MISKIDLNGAPPVAIGGVGGSGTRLVANALLKLGYYLGSDLNHAADNEWFAYLFRRRELIHDSNARFDELLDVFLTRMTSEQPFTVGQSATVNALRDAERLHYPPEWAGLRADSLCTPHPSDINNRLWGWKEPNTHIVLDRLVPRVPGIKYIHVIRNGLDMAYSRNQNQLRLWGPLLLEGDFEINAFYSLKFWRLVHERLFDMQFAETPDFLLLDFDRLCLKPESGFKSILEFLELKPRPSRVASLSELVRPPASIGRHIDHGIMDFDPDDVAFVRKLGFDVC